MSLSLILPLIYHHTFKDSPYLKILSVIICIPYEMRIIGGVGKAGFWGSCLWDVGLHCIPAFGEWLGGPKGNNTQVRAAAVLNLVILGFSSKLGAASMNSPTVFSSDGQYWDEMLAEPLHSLM